MVDCKDNIGNIVKKLARLSIVNYNGNVLLDNFYKVRLIVILSIA